LKQTQSSVLLDDFEDKLDVLLDFVLDAEADNHVDEPCHCGNGQRNLRCSDCFQFSTKCSHCFVSDHINAPFHWAEQWNGEYFERVDISTLGHNVSLGHGGMPCPKVGPSTSAVNFIIVDTNGIHETRLSFCGCVDAGDRVKQLMGAQLFPSTTTQPTLAFTFRVLKDFHLQTLESKKSAYDYIGALRRLTNNAFPDDVPVSALIFL